MSSTNKAGMRAGVLGLAVGCGVAVWLAARVVAGSVGNPPSRPADPAKPAVTPTSPLAGQLGQLGGQQLGQLGGLGLQPAGPPVLSPEDDEMRLRFPLESLAERLDYEKAGREARTKGEPAPRMTKWTRLRLDEFEERIGEKANNERTRALMELHVGRVRQFVNSPGMGFSRMGVMPRDAPLIIVGPPLSPVDLEYPKSAPLRFTSERDADPGPQAAEASRRQAPRGPGPNMLAWVHERGLLDFLDPAGFGYVKDREHVAGFEPHQFRRAPELADAAERWAVVRLELVSLLKHKEPVAYVTGVLPSMEDADRAKTRPLSPFEEKALPALREEGFDLVTETSGGRIRMVGSLRAGKQCLDCHGVERGDLLGAFSWELQRQPVKEDRLP